MDDKELYDAAVSDAPPTPEPAATPEPTKEVQPTPDQPRDDHGRWAPKEEQPSPVVEPAVTPAATEPEKKPDDSIPPWRLGEVTRERDAERERNNALLARLRMVEQELVKSRPQEPRPDFFENPDNAVQHTVAPRFQSLEHKLMHNSQLVAVAVHGQEKVAAADAAFTKAYEAGTLNPADYHTVINNPNIFDAAVKWYARQQVIEKTGGNLDDFLAKHQEQLLNDPAFMQKVGERLRGQTNGSSPSPVSLPPSLSRVAAAASSTESGGDLSDASLYRYATK